MLGQDVSSDRSGFAGGCKARVNTLLQPREVGVAAAAMGEEVG